MTTEPTPIADTPLTPEEQHQLDLAQLKACESILRKMREDYEARKASEAEQDAA